MFLLFKNNQKILIILSLFFFFFNIVAVPYKPGIIKRNILRAPNRDITGNGIKTGSINIPVLLIDFQDMTHNSISTISFYSNLLFKKTGISLRNYYNENSKDRLDINGRFFGWYHSTNTKDYYSLYAGVSVSSYPNNAVGLIEEALGFFTKESNIDYTIFDNDKDGYMDVVFVIHAGPGNEITGDNQYIHSHFYVLTENGQSLKPYILSNSSGTIKVLYYAIFPEFVFSAGDSTIGVFAHEFGHVLGLPDLYDTDMSSYGIGVYGLMSTGAWAGTNGSRPVNLCAWSKYYLGWANIVDIYKTGDYTLLQVEDDNTIYKLQENGYLEYFLIENREKTGYDKELPGAGLLIYHIDENTIFSNLSYNTVNDKPEHKGVDIEEADGNDDLDHLNNSGDQYDFWFSNNDGFNPYSIPSSDYYSGNKSFFYIGAISEPDEIMELSIRIPNSYSLIVYPNPFTINTGKITIDFAFRNSEAVFNMNKLFIIIMDSSGQEIISFSGANNMNSSSLKLYWDGKLKNGKDAEAGIYFYTVKYNGISRVRGSFTIID